jgi:hypothetical protein
MYQQLWGYKVEERGTRTKKVEYHWPTGAVLDSFREHLVELGVE